MDKFIFERREGKVLYKLIFGRREVKVGSSWRRREGEKERRRLGKVGSPEGRRESFFSPLSRI
jgi:hypothetical protein